MILPPEMTVQLIRSHTSTSLHIVCRCIGADDLRRSPLAFGAACKTSGGLGPCESGNAVKSGELVWVPDGVDAADAPVLDDDAHGGVDLPGDIEPNGG